MGTKILIALCLLAIVAVSVICYREISDIHQERLDYIDKLERANDSLTELHKLEKIQHGQKIDSVRSYSVEELNEFFSKRYAR